MNHANMVTTLKKPGNIIHTEFTPDKADLMHAMLGIAGEAGELVDTVKKHIIYGQDLNVENLIEELGDMEFYLEQLRQNIKVSREKTLQYNMAKLALRYPGYNYSDQSAKERADKV